MLQSLGAVSAKLKPGAQLKLQGTLSEGGTLSVSSSASAPAASRQDVQGRRQEGQEVHRPHEGRHRQGLGVGGSSTVTLPKRKLAAGDYRAVVTPIDAAGNKGAAKTVTFKVLKK